MKVYSPAKAVSEKEEAILKLEERTALVTGVSIRPRQMNGRSQRLSRSSV
jgi:hypothetical protein